MSQESTGVNRPFHSLTWTGADRALNERNGDVTPDDRERMASFTADIHRRLVCWSPSDTSDTDSSLKTRSHFTKVLSGLHHSNDL